MVPGWQLFSNSPSEGKQNRRLNFMRWFQGGNFFQIVHLKENKIDDLNTNTGTVHGQQEPIHGFCCCSKVFLHSKQCVPPMPAIMLAIMSMQFPITNSCEKSKYLHVSLGV